MTRRAETPEIGTLEAWLRRVRAAVRQRLVASASLRVLAAALGAMLVLVLADAALRLPAWLRWAHLVIGVGALVWAVRARVAPAWRFRPSLTSVALRVESRVPAARGRLASAVELDALALRSEGVERDLAVLSSRRLAAELGWEEAARASGLEVRGPLRRAAGAALAVVVVSAALAAAFPGSAWTGVVRAAAPWAGAEWPKRTEIADATVVSIHPKGEPAPLRVVLSSSHRAPDRTDVSARVRVLEGGEVVDRYRALASWQRRRASSVGDELVEGELFEVLAEGTGDALEYRFESVDDETGWRRIELVDRPAVRSASATIRRPPYLIATAPESEPESVSVDLGRGLDERATAPASLSGSSVSVTLGLNKPAEARPGDAGWVRATFGERAPEMDVEVLEGGTVWTLSFELDEPARVGVSLVDEHGIESEEPVVFRFPSSRDGAPSVVVLEPARDLTALPGAVIELSARGRDDVALASLWASAQRHAPAGAAPSGPEGAVAPAGEAEVLERASVSAGELTAEVSATVELERFGVEPGDELHLWATAADVFAYETGRRGPVDSAVRRVLVVSEQSFVEGVRGDLSAMRREAIRLCEGQQRLAGETARGEAGAGEVRREQESLARDLERQVERAEALRERIRQNRLEDEALESLTEGARALSESASGAARRAGERAAERERTGEAPGEEVERAQERALDELGELIALLDSGEDAWSARRGLEDLAREQRENLEATRELGRETAGLSPEQLSEEQRERLEEISETQRELAERSRAATQGLRETAEKLAESDPATSSALQQAAEQLERSGTSGRMQEAAEQAQENRTARSSTLQQEAAEELEGALEQLDDAERARDEQLRRVAQSLVDTISGLVETQRAELGRLEGAGRGALPGDLDDGMIALHRRTIAAQQTALSERELRPAAAPLGEAADAQLRAVSALRGEPVDREGALGSERESLAALERALEEAERLRDRLEEEALEEEREELGKAYRAALAAQIELRRAAREAAPGGEVDRRARAELRRLARDQRELAGTIGELYAETQELSDAVVFEFAHRKLDAAMEGAMSALGEGDAGAADAAQSRAVSLLRGLVDSLEEEPMDDDDGFDEGGGGGGSGSGGGSQGGEGLLPGAAQLKLLRSIQGDLLERTRAVDEGSGLEGDLELIGGEQRELSEVGEALIEELSQQNQPGGVQPNREGGANERPRGDEEQGGDEGGSP